MSDLTFTLTVANVHNDKMAEVIHKLITEAVESFNAPMRPQNRVQFVLSEATKGDADFSALAACEAVAVELQKTITDLRLELAKAKGNEQS